MDTLFFVAIVGWILFKLFASDSGPPENRAPEYSPPVQKSTPQLNAGLITKCHLAGVPHHIGGKKAEYFSIFSSGQRLVAMREPTNLHDKNAIVLRTQAGKKVGYVPRSENRPHSSHMDAGGRLEVEIVSVDSHDPWHGVSILVRNI